MVMTPEEFKAALPIQLKSAVTDEVMNSVNAVLAGPEATAAFKENLLSYSNVLLEGRFKMTSYVSAVRYVSFKLLGGTNKAAFAVLPFLIRFLIGEPRGYQRKTSPVIFLPTIRVSW